MSNSVVVGRNGPVWSKCSKSACQKCQAVFRVDSKTHQRNRAFTHQKTEAGGSLALDFQQRVLLPGVTDTGKYNQIQMSRGTVDFHSHPGQCLNDNTCALGLPSPMDLCNILVGVLFGTVAHMVYAKEGTYLVRVQPWLRLRAEQSRKALDAICREIQDDLNYMHNRFIRSPNMRYSAYRDAWLKRANELGFDIQLYQKDAVPEFNVEYDCALNSFKGNFSGEVEVPDELEPKDMLEENKKKKMKKKKNNRKKSGQKKPKAKWPRRMNAACARRARTAKTRK